VRKSTRGKEPRLEVPQRYSSELGPCTGVGKAFQDLFSHRCGFACMQNSRAKQRLGHSSEVGEQRLRETSGGENTQLHCRD